MEKLIIWFLRVGVTSPYEVFFVRKSSAVKVHKEMFKDDPELRKEFQVVKCERDEDL